MNKSPNGNNDVCLNDPGASMTYEQRLSANPTWALTEASLFLRGDRGMRDALHKLVNRLNELNIVYVVVGGLAMFQHGYRRITEEMDVLVTADGYRRACAELEGKGYSKLKGRRQLYDTENGMNIKFVVEGDFPGDGTPKPVAFPNPAEVGVEKDGVRYLNLPKLIELKLASANSYAARLRHFSDVMELIKLLRLPQDFRDRLNPFVRSNYDQVWCDAHCEGADVFEQ
jgi:hypothetical protein